MANETWTSDKKDRTLHIMYFVDSESTKTVSLRLRHIKLAIVGVAAFATLSMTSTAVAVLLGLQIKHMENKSREMKTAMIAQSIVQDNLLKAAPAMVASGSNVALNPSVSSIAAALAAGKAMIANSEESALADAEPADEEPNASANRQMNTNQSAQTSEPVDAARKETTQEAAEANLHAGEGKDKNTMAMAAKPNQAATDLQQLQAGKGTVPEQTTNKPSKIDTAVVFDDFKSSYDSTAKKITVEFNIRKKLQNNVTIDGKFCAVINGITSQGKTISLVFPPGTTPDELQSQECAHAYPVRLARFRPTALSFISEPLKLESATLLFASGTSKTLFSTPLNETQR